MELLPKTVTRPVGRLGAAAQNALEIARFGGLTTGEQPSPFEVVSEHRVYRLRRYYPDSDKTDRPPVLLVPPLMLATEIYDVSEQTSAVTILDGHGVDPWVVDFGAPEHQEGGLERTLTDHVLAVDHAIDRVREVTGQDVNLAGYSQGGMFCYQVAAYRRSKSIASLITFGSPVDTAVAIPFGLPEQLAQIGAGVLGDRIFGQLLPALPAWMSRTGFRLLDPVKSARNRVAFILQLHDREALLPREGQRRFLEADGWVAWPGPALAEFLQQFVTHNRMLEGGFVIEDRLLSLADIACPIFTVVGTVDEIAPAAGVRAIRQAAPRADIYEMTLKAGHFGLVVGSTANTQTWPTVAGWARWRAGQGERPEALTQISDEDAAAELKVGGGATRAGYGLELASGVSGGIIRQALRATGRTASSVAELTREAASQLPRIVRLEQIQPNTRISIGLLVEERREKSPDQIFFLFGDRAYTARDINERIDNVVRGLISIGIRQGERVGVLMSARPTALALAVAINRLGAVAVMLRVGGNQFDLETEADLSAVRYIIADPERAPLAAGLAQVHNFVLGGGGGPRDLGVPFSLDMEQIDPEAVELPGWYQPNPGRAADLAFIVFTGEGDTTRVHRITNSRWAMSAFGTASSAALTSADTVYSVTPLYHPSGLMMSIGGAVAGGARLALATTFDPTTFWDEARRYGVTVGSYTWTMLHDLVNAPANPGERHHSLRLFIGSGMPTGLWQRVQERFKPARVLEFYAATEAGAILVNLTSAKPGSMGRPLPGSARVQIADYDPATGEYVLDERGFVRPCVPNQTGMLLARAVPGHEGDGSTMRGVFERGDAWVEIGDLFQRDGDGDYWRMDNVADVIRTERGAVFRSPIVRALGAIPAIDLAVVYALPGRGGDGDDVVVAAVTLRDGQGLHQRDLVGALASVRPDMRPDVVHVVDEIAMTTWFRPTTGALKRTGIPVPGDDTPAAWYLDRQVSAYRALTAKAHARLLSSPENRDDGDRKMDVRDTATRV